MSPEEIEVIKKLYDDGATFSAIAAVTGISRPTVYRLLIKTGCHVPHHSERSPNAPPSPFADESQRDLLARMHRAGYQTAEIANRFGVSPATIRSWYHRLGLSPRRYTRITEGVSERIIEMRLDGMYNREIAEVLGCSIDSVQAVTAGMVREAAARRKEERDEFVFGSRLA